MVHGSQIFPKFLFCKIHYGRLTFQTQQLLKKRFYSFTKRILQKQILITSFQELKVRENVHVLIFNVILFSLLFTYNLIERLSVFRPCFFFFFSCIQNNREYLIQNTVHQLIQIYHFTLKLVF